MKRRMFQNVCLLFTFVTIFLCGNVFSATYDLTGTWHYTLSNSWARGDVGCTARPEASGICTISQSGDTFSFTYNSGVSCSPIESCTFQGTIAGSVYTGMTTDIVDDEGGSVTSSIVFNASSITSCIGEGTSIYTHPSGQWTCNWGNGLTLTRDEDDIQEIKYSLSVNIVGSGSVTLNPSGGSYDPDTIVELTATPGAGETFVRWSRDLSGTNNSETITMDENKNVTAYFTGETEEDNETSCFVNGLQF